MISFERNGNAKESIGIGLAKDAIPIYGVKGEIHLYWRTKNDNNRYRSYNLKKRWFVPLKNVSTVMNLSEVPIRKLRWMFKAKTTESDFIESAWQFLTPWGCIKNRVNKNKRSKGFIEVDLSSRSFKKFNVSKNNSAEVKFAISTNDIKKAEEIKNSDKPLDKIIIDEKIYNINPDTKSLK